MSILQETKKIKEKKDRFFRFFVERKGPLFISLCFILLGLASFGLGRLSALEDRREAVVIDNKFAQIFEEQSRVLQTNEFLTVPTESVSTKPASPESGVYVASRNGSRYHLPSCSGAQRILEENKVWFSSREEAEKAGYTPAQNCPGL